MVKSIKEMASEAIDNNRKYSFPYKEVWKNGYCRGARDVLEYVNGVMTAGGFFITKEAYDSIMQLKAYEEQEENNQNTTDL